MSDWGKEAKLQRWVGSDVGDFLYIFRNGVFLVLFEILINKVLPQYF